jgi:hypothetical protein
MGFEHETHRPFGIKYHGHPLGRSLSTQDRHDGLIKELDARAV